MKLNFLILLIAICTHSFLNAQVSGAAPTTEAGMFASAQGGNPTLNLVMMDIRTRKQKDAYLGEVVGSPYLSEDFIKGKIYYDDEILGDFLIRYNALASEIEIKKTDLAEEEPKRLLADSKLRVKYRNRELRFTTYINKKEETKNGYLTRLVDGDNFKLYHRLAVKYSEGKKAANSMVSDIPSRFAHFEEYYYQKTGVNRIDYLYQSKGKFLKLFDKEQREIVQSFMKENKIDMDQEADLIRTFQFLNTL